MVTTHTNHKDLKQIPHETNIVSSSDDFTEGFEGISTKEALLLSNIRGHKHYQELNPEDYYQVNELQNP